MKRIYLDRSDCGIEKGVISVRGDTFHYLANLLRMKEGDIFSGFDGTGFEHSIKIFSVGKEHIEASILESKKIFDAELPFILHLFQSIPKRGKMDSIVRDVAQLGAKKITPLLSERVIGSLNPERMTGKKERWEKIAAESSRIAGRQVVTGITDFLRFEDAVRIRADISMIFWEKAIIPLREIMRNLPGLNTDAYVKIFVGPEGGFTDEEISMAEGHGAVPVSMGKRILKVETASVIAAALTIYELEDRFPSRM